MAKPHEVHEKAPRTSWVNWGIPMNFMEAPHEVHGDVADPQGLHGDIQNFNGPMNFMEELRNPHELRQEPS